jgi:hypothetical protein
MFPTRALVSGLALLCAVITIALTFKAPSALPNQRLAPFFDDPSYLIAHNTEIPKVTDRQRLLDSSPPVVTASIVPSQAHEPYVPELNGSLAIEFPTTATYESPIHSRKVLHRVARSSRLAANNKPVPNKPKDAFTFSQGAKQDYNYKPVPIPKPNSTNSAY